MPESIAPMSDGVADKVLSKQQYKDSRINQNMFSSATRKDKKVMLPETPLKGLTIQKLWDSVFQDNTEFLKKYHDKRNESKLEVGPWEYASDHGSGYRFVSLVTVVEVPRANTPTPLNEAHRFAFCTTDDGKLMLTYQISSQTPNVPAGGSFRTEAYMEITASSAEADCSIAIWGNCRKMSISFSAIQYIATPRAIKEMTAAYRQMVNMISEEFCGGAATTPETDDDAGKPPSQADGDGDSGGGDGGSLGSVFHGALLVLALLVTLLIFSSTRTVSRTSSYALAMLNQDRIMRDDYVTETGRGNGAAASAGASGSGGAWMCEEKALLVAAREAQLQTLRYRWMEQQAEIDHLQQTVSFLKSLAYVQVAATALMLCGLGFLLRKYLAKQSEGH